MASRHPKGWEGGALKGLRAGSRLADGQTSVNVVPWAGVCLAYGQTSGNVEAVHPTGPPPEHQRGEARAEASPPTLPTGEGEDEGSGEPGRA